MVCMWLACLVQLLGDRQSHVMLMVAALLRAGQRVQMPQKLPGGCPRWQRCLGPR